MRVLLNRLRVLLGCTAGVSAVEFAVLAPFLVVGTLSTIDAGMAVYEKMMIGQVRSKVVDALVSTDSGVGSGHELREFCEGATCNQMGREPRL